MSSKVHFDASKPDDVLPTAYCGWIGSPTDTDITKVTCRRCRAMRQAKAEPAPPRASKPKEENESALDRVIRTLLKPKADAPPRLTDRVSEDDPRTIWEASCKGALFGRCKSCAICLWEVQADTWEYAAPDRFVGERIRFERGEHRPRWGSMAALMFAWVEFERHGREPPSAMGGLIARGERGCDIDGGKSKPEDPMLSKAEEFTELNLALAEAYPERGHPVLSAAECRWLLVIRTKGVLVQMPTYEELAEQLGQPVGELRALVRAGRDRVELALFERGLIPRPKMWRAERAAEQS